MEMIPLRTSANDDDKNDLLCKKHLATIDHSKWVNKGQNTMKANTILREEKYLRKPCQQFRFAREEFHKSIEGLPLQNLQNITV